jgi:CelD/BcsL family acetyltransferase involved in cellulose biosynthesis
MDTILNSAIADEEKDILTARSCPERLNSTEVTRSRVGGGVAYCIEPLKDPRWDKFLQRHPRASVFHSSPWLAALSRTYGYEPIAYTTSAAGQDLENGIVFCRVESWLTGRRLVSLPFSDHCELLVDEESGPELLAAALDRESRHGNWRYVEIRPLTPMETVPPRPSTAVTYAFHELDLGPDIETIFRNLHKNSTQRKIRRAEREGLTYREGSAEEFLDIFYTLFKVTRRRHKLPPQPRQWFENLGKCFGDALKIRVAFQGDQAIAAILTIRYKDAMAYKYGGCESRFNNLGSMHLLLWRAIQEAKASGLRIFDFGRTDAGQDGLITFKNRWGAAQTVLTYSRYGASEHSTHLFDLSTAKWKSRAVKGVLGHLQPAALSILGKFLYRHVG